MLAWGRETITYYCKMALRKLKFFTTRQTQLVDVLPPSWSCHLLQMLQGLILYPLPITWEVSTNLLIKPGTQSTQRRDKKM